MGRYESASYGPEPDGAEQQPELADIGRLARRVLRRAVNAARADDASIPRILRSHLGPGAAGFPVVRSTWPRYDQVNVQEGLGAWLAEQGREHHTVGLTSSGSRTSGWRICYKSHRTNSARARAASPPWRCPPDPAA